MRPYARMSLADAEVILLSNKKGKSVFQNYKVPILRALCSKYGLAVQATGKKGSPIRVDYTKALFTYKVRAPF